MINYIHLISRNLAVGRILKAFNLYGRKEEKEINIRPIGSIAIREFKDDLSIGPIGNYENQLSNRKEWFKELITVRGTEWDFPVDVAVDNLFLEWDKIGENEKLVLWYGDNIRDYMMLRYLVSKYRNHELYEANISDNLMYEIGDKSKTPQVLMECTAQQVYEVFKKITLMTEERKQQLIHEWEQLQKGKGVLRDLNEGQVRELEKDYYDEDLLQGIDQQNYEKVEMVLARAMNKIKQEQHNVVSRLWLEYRLKEMEYEGKIMSKTKTNQLGQLLIKKVL